MSRTKERNLRVRQRFTSPSPHQPLPSAQEDTLLRRPEPKSFISKPLDSKARFIAVANGMVTGFSSEGSGARRCPGCGRLPVSRVSAPPPNPAWRPKQPSLRPPISATMHQTVPRVPPEPHGSPTVVPSIRIEGTTVRPRWNSGGSRRDARCVRRLGGQGAVGGPSSVEKQPSPSDPGDCGLRQAD